MPSRPKRLSPRSPARAAWGLLVLGLLVAAALGAGCGGAEDTELFGSPAPSVGQDGGEDAQVGVDPVTPDDAQAPRDSDKKDSGNPNDSGALDTGASDTGPVDTGAPDTGSDTGAPDAPTTDGGEHEPATILCGLQKCAVPAEDCCRTRGLIGSEVSYACVAKGTCTGLGALTVPCDDADDCTTLGQPGLCCMTTSGQMSTVTDVRCRAAQECATANRNNLCDPGLARQVACPNAGGNVSCKRNPSASFDFFICIP